MFVAAALLANLAPVPATEAQTAEAPAGATTGEQAERRTRTSKTVRHQDGSLTTTLFNAPVHYKDRDGSWQEIDSSLVEDRSEGYAFRNKANTFGVAFKDQLVARHLRVRVDGKLFTLTLEDAAKKTATAKGSTVTYPEIAPGVDLRYDVGPEAVKETLVIATPEARRRFRFRLAGPSSGELWATRRPDGGADVWAADRRGAVFSLAAPYAADSASGGQPGAGSAPNAAMTVTKDGAELVVDLAVDEAWAAAPERQYPVYLDPTLVIQPSAEDASFRGDCSTCTATTAENLYIGTNSNQTWRAALKFDLSSVPANANVTDAKLSLYHHTACVPNSPAYCGGVSHTLNAHRVSTAWTATSTSSAVSFDDAAVSSFVLPGGATNLWMSWGVTQTVKNWLSGASANNGVLIKRDAETLNQGGPAPAGKRYTADAGLRPKLEVTYTSDAVDLVEPDTLHADGAELRWSRFAGEGGSVFQKYEVHRAPGTASFTPSAATLLTTIRDAAVTTYRDTTAKAGTAFTYRIVANADASNARTVTLPVTGQSKKILQPNAAEGRSLDVDYFSNTTSCSNYGSDHRIFVGPAGSSLSRGLLDFDLRGIPATATVNSASLELWQVDPVQEAMVVRAHRVTKKWKEGTGSGTCTGDGATWYDAHQGARWGADGGDFDATAVTSVTKAAGDAPRWDAYDVASLVQQWANGTHANLGVMLKADDESPVTKYLYYYSDDVASAPTLRPKLTVVYTDGSAAKGPKVDVASPGEGSKVAGNAVAVTAGAGDDRRVDKVEFLVDGVLKATDTAAPYSYTWDSTTATNASHSLTARATDDAGNLTASPPVSVTVDNSALPTTSVAAPTGTPYATAVQADAPRGWWRLGDAAGSTTATDSSVNAIHGTYRAGAAPGQPGALAQDNNGAAKFPATAEGVDVSVPDNALLDFGTGDFSAEAWVKTTLHGERTIVGKSDNVAANWRVTVTDDAGYEGRVRATIFDGTTTRTAYGPPTRVDDAAWHHVAVVWQRSYGTRVYVDGMEQATGGTAPNSVSNTATLNIGDTAGYPPLNGEIDEVAVFPVALLADRVRAHYDAGVVKGTLTVDAAASDDKGVSNVEFYADGVRFADDATAPYSASWNTLDPATPAFDGPRVLTTKALDTSGQVVTSSSVTKTVANSAYSAYRAGFATSALPPAVVWDPSLTTQDKSGVDVTVTNRSTATWSTTDHEVRYRWLPPDGGAPVDGAGVAFASAVAPGASQTVRVLVDPPPLPDGVDRAQYTLRFDVFERSTATWFAAKGNAPNDNPVVVNRALAGALGLERYYHYTGTDVGAGMGHLLNVANGNSLLRWSPFMAPGRGLSSVVDLTYNSAEQRSESPAGNNWSLSISSLVRLGSMLDVHPNNADSIAGRSNRWIALTDGDGTTHRFEGKQAADGTVYWEQPAGVHLYLREFSATDATRKWALTRPDRVTFFFDADGYPTGVEDANGNRLDFTLSAVAPGDDPGGAKKRVTKVTDAAGMGASPAPNRSFAVAYYTKDEAKKPQVRGKVRRITDHSGSALDFEYYEDGNLRRLIQRGDTKADGTHLADRGFVFTYTTSAGDAPAIADPAARVDPDPKTANQSSRLYSVRDPRGAETRFSYYGPTSGQLKGKLASLTDRAGAQTTVAYDLAARLTTLTAPLSRVSKYAYDIEGKVTTITNPKNEATQVAWTPDRHVAKVTEPTGAFTEFTYNANGYLTDAWDQLRNRTTLTYENIAVDANDASGKWKAGRSIPHISQLATKTEPKGTATASPTDDFQWSFAYDTKGNLTRATDPEGFATNHAYNADGTTATTTDAQSKTTTYNAYDANGLVTKLTDAKGQVTNLGYDADGLLTFVQDARHASDSGDKPEEYQARFSYDAFHRLGRQSAPKSTEVDRGNLIWSAAEFDANDNVVGEVGPHYGAQYTGAGSRTTREFDSMDRLTRVTGADTSADPAGERTELAYDAAGRLTKRTEPKGVASTNTAEDFAEFLDYDTLDRVVKHTRKEVSGTTVTSTYLTHACYDTAGDLRSVTSPRANLTTVDCASTTTAFTARFDYDPAHRPTTETDPLGRKRSRTYDANGNVATTTDENGAVTTTTYDRRDLPATVVEPFDPSATPARTLTTKFDYDGVGNRTRLITPRAYDASADKATFAEYVTSYAYDAVNQLERVALPKAGTEAQLYVHHAYDAVGNLTMSATPDTNADPSLVPAAKKTTVSYFDPGWVRRSADATKAHHFDYTPEGWQSARTPEDASGRLVADQRMGWAYFADGQLKERADRGGQKATYAYDANDNLTSATEAAGLVAPGQSPLDIASSYDGLNRVAKVREKKKADANYRFTTFAYDLNSNVVDREDDGEETPAGAAVKAGRKHRFDYDGADQLASHLDFGISTAGSDDQRITNVFAPTGWETKRTIEASNGASGWNLRQTTTWDHFANGLVKKLTVASPAATLASHTVGYESSGVYLNGHRTTDTFTLATPSGQTSPCRASACAYTYSYDARERLTERVLTNSAGAVVSSDTFSLDAAGNVTKEDVARSGTTTSRTMAYSGDRLTALTAAEATQRYFYDAEGNLDCVTTDTGTGSDCNAPTGAAVSPKVVSDHGYDYLDRLLSYRSYTTDGTTSANDDAADYTYDALDRTVEQVESHGTAPARTTAFAYLGLSSDLAEEQHKDGAGTLVTTKSYGYDAFGERTSLATTPAGGPTSVDTYGYDTDDSVSLLVDAAGAAKASYGYRPYGEGDTELTKGDTNADNPTNPFRYAAKRFDSGSGTIDMGARRFGPSTGRFFQQDRFSGALNDLALSSDPLTQNRYSLAGGNPVSFVEVDGHWVKWKKIARNAKRALSARNAKAAGDRQRTKQRAVAAYMGASESSEATPAGAYVDEYGRRRAPTARHLYSALSEAAVSATAGLKDVAAEVSGARDISHCVTDGDRCGGAAVTVGTGFVGKAVNAAKAAGRGLKALKRGNKAPNTASSVANAVVHGNSRLNTKTTYLYRLSDDSGNYLKTGITSNPGGRYTQKFLLDKRLDFLTSGSRSDMLNLERFIV